MKIRNKHILIISFVFLMFITTLSSVVYSKENEIYEVSYVGYNEEDKYEIFGNKSEDEINRILIDELNSRESLNKNSKDYKDELLLKNGKNFPQYLSKLDIKTRVIDEKPLDATYVYKVYMEGFGSNNVYKSRVKGHSSNNSSKAIITNLHTVYLSGASFKITDQYGDSSYAKTRFGNWVVAGEYRFRYSYFTAHPNGISFDGVQ